MESLCFSTIVGEEDVIPTDIPTEIPAILVEPPVITNVVTEIPAISYTEGESITIKYSRYDPSLGGVNCAKFVDGVCVSNMASGRPWLPYMDKACACPPQWAFGTIIVLDGKEWECLDRGGAIKFDAQGYTYVDFLTQNPTHKFGEYVEVVKIDP